jgi:hypothetical protein
MLLAVCVPPQTAPVVRFARSETFSMRAVRVCNTFSTLHRELRHETNTPGFWSRTKRRESRLETPPIRGRCRTSPTAHHFARTWTTSLW